MDYRELILYIENTDRFGSSAGLEYMEKLCEKLGNPEKSLKFVHIAGTNGKGSCAAMLSSVLKCCGLKTGLYTSPHLVSWNERLQINGKEIENDAFAAVLERVKKAADEIEDGKPAQFELLTAAAFLWFSQENCDIVVLETGLGGRLDATNVIEAPECSVIMNIGLDHTGILGDTVEKIAAEKAGIIKRGRPCVLYGQGPGAGNVIKARCAETGSELITADFSRLVCEFDTVEGQVFSYKGRPCALSLAGEYQRKNAAVVLEIAGVLKKNGFKLPDTEVEHGLYAAAWPGRFELMSDDPYFVLDGGHNAQCAEAVKESLEYYFAGEKKVLLLGVLADKNYEALLDVLAPLADEFVCVTPEGERALPAAELGKILEKYGKTVTVMDSVTDGVGVAIDIARETGAMVCATGSLHIVGEVREYFGLN